MPVNRAPTIDDLISQAQGKMQNTSSLLRYVLLAESLKIWVPCDNSSSDDSSSDESSSEDSWSDDSSTDDGAGSAPAVSGAGVEAQGKMQNTSSLLRYVSFAESLKICVPCDDSSSDDSSSDDSSSKDSWSDDSSTDDGADDDAGPPCKRRRVDNFPGEGRGDTDDLNTLEPRPGPSSFQDNSSDEDDGDV
ncbi:hypothetical protein HPB51_028681 [Rhipicephalus microplus]|uniref:Uncharacterized protein n=1 Tax=Rhipicephalus microplus TaxID=6941 RepID=A0A9J6CWT7_RHIMP|nr:hypothetical protein HPB51_028681 [Rhipicephalus microplus]